MLLPLVIACLAVTQTACNSYDEEVVGSQLYDRLKKYEDFDLLRKDFYPPAITSRRDSTVELRLPKTIRPLHYDIQLQVYHWGNQSFVGKVSIEVEALEDATSILLNSLDLDYTSAAVSEYPSPNVSIEVTEVQSQPLSEQIEVFVKPPLRKGVRYMIVLSYEGRLRSDGLGLYQHSYVDSKKAIRKIAMTQLQATYARQVFPCFDEPEFKARFTLHLARPANSTAISNTDLVSTAPFLGFEEYEWDNFETTVRMSTYLFAFAITQFKPLTSTHYGVTYRVFMKPELLQYGQFTLDYTPRFVRFFERFFDVEYPLPKLDSLGSPRMVGAGMENWGLITYRENKLLVTKDTGIHKRITSSNLIAHEVAHQWFGNLVTPKWWSDIWLNEGFASYMSLRALHDVMPTVDAMDLFVTTYQMTAMALDSTTLSVPVVTNVSTVSDIDARFNRLTYTKGASIIRMMDHFLTTKTFQRGVTNYLNKFQYSNADQNDLWDHLTEVALQDGSLPPNLNVKDIMDTWTKEKYYPVVTINRHLNGSCTIYQKPFISEKVNLTADQGLWWVPVSVLTEGSMTEDTIPTLWLPPNSKEMFLAGLPHHPRWVILNVHQTAYYRVNYDYVSWMCLIRQLQQNHSAIPVISRAQLIDDAFHLFMENELESPDILFMLMSYLENEDDYLPWLATIRAVEDIYDHIKFQPEFFELKAYLQKLTARVFSVFGVELFKSEGVKALLATRIQKLACGVFDKECERQLLERFEQWKETGDLSVVQDSLVTNMLCTGVKHSDEHYWESLWRRARMNKNLKARHRILAGLACTNDPWTLKRYTIESFKYRDSLGFAAQLNAIRMISRNPISYDFAWNLIRDTVAFRDRFGLSHVPGPILRAAVATLNQPRHLMELARYFKANPVYSGTDIKLIMNRVSDNIKWLNKYHKPLSDWLGANYPFDNLLVPVAPPGQARNSYRSPRKIELLS